MAPNTWCRYLVSEGLYKRMLIKVRNFALIKAQANHARMRLMALPQPGQDAWCAPVYVRHKPEQTLLYQLVEQYWPEFQTQLSETGRFLPRHVTREFED